jgi:hypothetical protein
MKTSVKNSVQVTDNQVVNNVETTKTTDNQVVKVKLTRLEKLNKAIAKAEISNANAWDKLGGASAEVQKTMFSLSEISKKFCESKYVNDKQRLILSKANILTFVRASAKYKDKILFSVNDVKLICNALIKANDNQVKVALKVTKQGGQIAQKLSK